MKNHNIIFVIKYELTAIPAEMAQSDVDNY